MARRPPRQPSANPGRMNLLPAAREAFPDQSIGVPIFMFHRVSLRTPAAGWPQLYIAPHTFAERMKSLKAAGAMSVRVDEPLTPGSPH